jgi:carbohydrate-selective porin OprB
VAFILLIAILWADYRNRSKSRFCTIRLDFRRWGHGELVRPAQSSCQYGAEVFGSYTAEVWGNVTGGLKQGGLYIGLLTFGLNLDLEKAVGWNGASVNMTWLWLSGGDASDDLVGNFLTISNISGFNTLRLFQF